jgi:superfamily I DNA/RNA helicase
MKITVIFGVPGSGKTTWLANKYAELLNTYEPSDIVFLSYTKRQVTHGKRKVKGKTHINMSKLTSFQTVHALSKKSYKKNYASFSINDKYNKIIF